MSDTDNPNITLSKGRSHGVLPFHGADENEGSDDENVEPATGEIPSQRSKKSAELKKLRKALRKLQDKNKDDRHTIKSQALEIEKLRASSKHKRLHRSSSQDADADNDGEDEDEDQSEMPHKQLRLSDHDVGTLRDDALHAGKKFTVCNSLWFDLDVIKFLPLLSEGQTSSSSLDEIPSETLEKAQEVYESLPLHLRPHTGQKWFRSRFKEGCHAIRSNQVNHINALMPSIFPELKTESKEFQDKSKRPHIPEVASLLDGKLFIYSKGPPPTAKDRLERHLRHPCILKALQSVLFGDTAVRTGSKSTKARRVNAELWRCTSVTDQMLAYAATIIYFTLSGEAEFTEETKDNNFRDFYNNRIDILFKAAHGNPAARRHYNNLIDFYNGVLFPEAPAEKSRFDEEETELLQCINEDEDEDGHGLGDDGDRNGGGPVHGDPGHTDL